MRALHARAWGRMGMHPTSIAEETLLAVIHDYSSPYLDESGMVVRGSEMYLALVGGLRSGSIDDDTQARILQSSDGFVRTASS